MKSKIYGVIAVTYIILAGVYLFFAFGWVKASFVVEKKTLAEQWVHEVDVDALEKLQGIYSDDTLPEYWALKKQLATWKESDKNIGFVSLFGQRYVDGKDQVFFFLDNVSHDNPDVSLPGDEYTEVSDEFRSVFVKGVAIVEGPIIDRWGVWMSANAPVYGQDGVLIAVLAVAYDISNYNKMIFIRFIPHTVGVILLGSVLFFAVRRRECCNIKKK